MSLQIVKVEKLIYGGQAIATLLDGRKVFLWDALPGERVEIELTKSKKDYAQGKVVSVISPSPVRVKPLEPNYQATSPWQIMSLDAEADYKKQIITETYEREGLSLGDFKFGNSLKQNVVTKEGYGYRNKMEYSFYGDELGIHIALYNRGTHSKSIVTGSALAMLSIDQAANFILKWINSLDVRASELKSLIVRSSQSGETLATLFVKGQDFPKLDNISELAGFEVYHSNPKSPASVATQKIYSVGSELISDRLLGKTISYNARSFFQVNIPVFETVLAVIKDQVGSELKVVDMYSGVGAIGLTIGAADTTLVELDQQNSELAKHNSPESVKVVNASTEKALSYIDKQSIIIFDPPRAGLHKDVVKQVLEVLPPKLIYLSCNPVTQARDVKLLSTNYEVTYFEGFNFFPRTPHIETLAVLVRK